jgi:hypothetical protein
MSKADGSSGSGNAGVVIVIVFLVLGVFCCGGIALFGAGFFFTAIDASGPQPQPPTVVNSMPMPAELMPREPLPPDPAVTEPPAKTDPESPPSGPSATESELATPPSP